MKLLLINSVYGTGSTGNIIKTLHNEFESFGHETYVIFGRGKKDKSRNTFKLTFEFESKIHHFISLFTGNLYGGMFFSTRRIIRKIKKIKPDVVNLHCLNGYFVNIYQLLNWLAKSKIPAVTTMHADFMMTGGCGIASKCSKLYENQCRNCPFVKNFNSKFSLKTTHRNFEKMNKAINNFSDKKLIVTCVSPFLVNRYKKSSIYKRFKIIDIFNPITMFEFNKKQMFSTKNNILHVTADFNNLEKGGPYIIELAKRLEDFDFYVLSSKKPDTYIDLENLHFLNPTRDRDELYSYYYSADLTCILSAYETFSMVTAESLSCGTPVIGFECGGPETIADPEFSLFKKQGDLDEIINGIKFLIKQKFNKNKIADNAQKLYSPRIISEKYISVFEKVLKNEN